MKGGLSMGSKKQSRLIIACAIVHLAASLFYEPVLFGAAAVSTLGSGDIGGIATLIASKLIGALLILLFWRTLIRLFAGSYPKRAVISFFVLFAVSLIVIAIVYPQNYAYETDSLLIYEDAITYQPAYWHHYLTGSFFAGCYMLLPHPVSLMLVQSAFFSALIASVFSRLAGRFGSGRAWFAFLLLLVPVSFYVQYSPYRNCLYTILCMFACSELLFFWLDGEAPPLWRVIRVALAFSLIAIWRSEGILLFLLLPLGLWLVCRAPARRVICLTLASAAAAMLLALPQTIGMAQSGMNGNYRIVSTMNALQDICNAADFSLDYDGGEEDAAIIESFVPSAYLKEYGLAGYRAFNAANGRNINDSGQTDDQIDAFMGAYARVVLHNLPAFVRSQGNRFLFALKFPEIFSADEFSGTHTELPAATVVSTAADSQEATLAALDKGAFWRAGSGSAAAGTGDFLRENLGNLIYLYDAKTRQASIVVRALLPIAAVSVGLIAGRRKKSAFPILFFVILAAELGAVILMAPEGRTAYYYPTLFCGYLFVLILAPFCRAGSGRKRLARIRKETEREQI